MKNFDSTFFGININVHGDNLDEKQFRKNLNKLLFLCIIITIGVVLDFLFNKSLINLCLVIIVLICTLIIFFVKVRWKNIKM